MKKLSGTLNITLLAIASSLFSCHGEEVEIITSPVTNIGSTSASSGGSIYSKGSAEVGERGVCWSNFASPTFLSDRTIDGSGTGTFQSTLSGLTELTDYYIRAYANIDGNVFYGNELTFTTETSNSEVSSQIIADHTVVDRYDKIPQEYIEKVKMMLVWVAGMSHSLGYQNGAVLLETLDSRFQVNTWQSEPPPAFSDKYLRIGRPFKSGVNAWTTDVESYSSVMEGQNNSGNPYSVFIYGWSYETTWNNPPGGGLDPVHNIHWAGDAGGYRWGLDIGDKELTGNPICMDTYLAAIEEYNIRANNNGCPTISVFSTGPVDENGGTECGFQRELKNSYIRSFVKQEQSRILFDYADILVHNNEGEKYTATWNDGGMSRSHSQIHPDNLKDYDSSWKIVSGNDADGDHIGEVGALRIAKAIWWLLARIAGWDGE